MLQLFDNEDFRIQQCPNTRRDVRRALDACRDERRPYLLLTPDMTRRPLRRILVPVSMLEEETYKGEICTWLARKAGVTIDLLCAHDYGSSARRNTERIATHIRAVAEQSGTDIRYNILQARKDSFHLMREAADATHVSDTYDLLVLTASREYGLDDWLFGPPELYAVRRSRVPVLLVNPRADLFSLCD